MKDAKGHGSNSRGDDAQAAGTLAQGHPKSVGVPVHAASLNGIFDSYARASARAHAPNVTMDLRDGVGRRATTKL
jgi:hypothetical protein